MPYEKDRPDGRKLYLSNISVLEAARKRIAWAFDTFAHVVCSISGGKDSTVVAHLAHEEASRRGRPLHLFFLDQEAEYMATIKQVERHMSAPGVVRWWYQVPIHMTNATSYEEPHLHAWEPGAQWVRPKHPLAITEKPNGAPDRFYPFMEWFEATRKPKTVILVGLRSEESLNRYAAVTRHAAIPGFPWTSRGAGGAVRAYPIYDWAYEDVWTYLGMYKIPYNRVYDWLYVKRKGIQEFRVSNLIHEKAFTALTTLQEFEPDTYDRLCKRLKGVHTAALYAEEATVFNTRRLPKGYKTWQAYRNFLLATYTGAAEQKAQFLARFADQPQTESVYRQQARQLLCNDYENNLPVVAQIDAAERRERIVAKWRELL